MKKLVSIFVLSLALLFGSSVLAVAQTATAPVPTSGGPVMINIDQNGNAMLRGEVESVGADFLVIKSWGSNLKVKVLSTTHIISKNGALSDFKVGDIAGVLGSVSEDGSFVIIADTVRAWGQRSDNDKDGIPDVQDKDDDNDGVADVNEVGKANDHDNDGIPDVQDQDDDNDGILDVNESGNENDHGDSCIAGEKVLKAYDHDNDGMSDSQDNDDDNDGIPDSQDTMPFDHDNNGKNDDVDKNN